MEFSLLVTPIQGTAINGSINVFAIVNFDDESYLCSKYFKGDLDGLLKHLPDVLDEDAENAIDGIETTHTPCEFCKKYRCNTRDHYLVIPSKIIDNIFFQLAEAKKDDIMSYVGEY